MYETNKIQQEEKKYKSSYRKPKEKVKFLNESEVRKRDEKRCKGEKQPIHLSLQDDHFGFPSLIQRAETLEKNIDMSPGNEKNNLGSLLVMYENWMKRLFEKDFDFCIHRFDKLSGDPPTQSYVNVLLNRPMKEPKKKKLNMSENGFVVDDEKENINEVNHKENNIQTKQHLPDKDNDFDLLNELKNM